MAVLTIKNCKKSFSDFKVLKGIDFSVEEGKVTSIIGASGGGKSTLLRICTFLEKMDSGEMILDGETICRDVDGKSQYVTDEELSRYRQKLGLVFQNFNLFPHYTVLKNLTDASIVVQKRDRKEVEEEAKVLLDSMGLLDKMDSYPQRLSGGQQQRVAIARALMMKPKVLFFDEPTSALDPELTSEVLSVIRQLADKKYTMVIVTHEMEFARKVSDKIVFIDKGEVVDEGSSEYIFTKSDHYRIKKFLQNYSSNV